MTDPAPAEAGIEANIAAVQSRVRAACDRASRDPASVTLIAVTKTHSSDVVARAYACGLRVFGENRVQEATAKITSLREQGVDAEWHLIGNLQRNKAVVALDVFDVIHSVDSLRLAETLNERAISNPRVLIEVNVSGEATKHGVEPKEAAALAQRLGAMRHIHLVGLMTVAPFTRDPEEVRPFFRRLRELRDAIGLSDLSMGMTNDFEVAIEEGTTFVRVGRAIFGQRPARL